MVFKTVLILLLALALLQTTGVSSLSLEISPRHHQTDSKDTKITVTCKADFNIKACQFMWMVEGYDPGPLIDLSNGTHSQVNQFFTSEVTNISYYGNGLEARECGAYIVKRGRDPDAYFNYDDWVLGCRVLAQDGGWVYKWMDVLLDIRYRLEYSVKPMDAVIFLPGDPAKFLVKTVDTPFYICQVKLMRTDKVLSFDNGNLSTDSTGRHLYYGEGLRNDECGLSIHNVTADEIGMVMLNLYDRRLRHDKAFIPIVAAIPPTQPVLRTVYNGEELTALCNVLESCPRANMTWLIDDAVIRSDQFDDSPTSHKDMWAWPWVSVPTTQSVTVTLKPEHAGKTLKCVVSHLALAEPLVASETITLFELML